MLYLEEWTIYLQSMNVFGLDEKLPQLTKSHRCWQAWIWSLIYECHSCNFFSSSSYNPRKRILFSPFSTTRSVAQESVILSECHIMHNMIFWPQMSYYLGFFQEIDIFQCKMSFNIHNEDTWVWKNIFSREICSQCHTIWIKKNIVL